MLGLPDDDSQGNSRRSSPSRCRPLQARATSRVFFLGGPGGIGQGEVSPAYAQRTMASLNQPMTWGAAARTDAGNRLRGAEPSRPFTERR